MEDELLMHCLLVYIKEITKKFNIDSIIDDFCNMQKSRSMF